MPTTTKLRSMITTAALTLLALFLIPAGAEAAKRAPAFAATPQYKALSQYVTKLERMQGTAASTDQKLTYERELTAKHGAAVNKSTALFSRAKQRAKVETQMRFAISARQARAEEAMELAELRSEYAERLDKAAVGYRRDLTVLESSYDARTKRLHQQISTLRMRKANAAGLDRKTQIQAQINVIVQQVEDSQKQQAKALKKLEQRYREQRAAIEAARLKEAGVVREASQRSIESSANKRNRAYNAKVASARTKRESQITDFEAKLAAGRLAISLMPTSG